MDARTMRRALSAAPSVEEFRQKSACDPLTGLVNRAGFFLEAHSDPANPGLSASPVLISLRLPNLTALQARAEGLAETKCCRKLLIS